MRASAGDDWECALDIIIQNLSERGRSAYNHGRIRKKVRKVVVSCESQPSERASELGSWKTQKSKRSTLEKDCGTEEKEIDEMAGWILSKVIHRARTAAANWKEFSAE